MELTVTAPGKLFVSGEYAVTCGAPAVAAAVTRRVACRARRRPGRGILSLASGRHACRLRLAEDDPASAPPELRFAAGAALVAARTLRLAGCDVEIEIASELDARDHKVGLGGSAAVTAATVAAIHGLAGEDPTGATTRAARVATGVLAHRLAQGGGSGADVVAATVGGLVWTTGLDARDRPRSVGDCAARVAELPPVAFAPLALPPGLAVAAVATGRPAASGPRVARFESRLERADGTADPVLAAWIAGMRCATDELAEGCRSGSEARVLAAVAAAGDLLTRLSALIAVPVLTRELRLACRAARGRRAAVKPSGAGGGDCAIAVVAETERADLLRAWARAGLAPLDLDVSPDGVRVEAPAAEAAHG
ncbi:MAG TPA: hypothetical protein VFD92_01695 [Candidatus Binatia bacterium]|nr:hypothetical protein [Candidatus Binatia bacterium]